MAAAAELIAAVAPSVRLRHRAIVASTSAWGQRRRSSVSFGMKLQGRKKSSSGKTLLGVPAAVVSLLVARGPRAAADLAPRRATCTGARACFSSSGRREGGLLGRRAVPCVLAAACVQARRALARHGRPPAIRHRGAGRAIAAGSRRSSSTSTAARCSSRGRSASGASPAAARAPSCSGGPEGSPPPPRPLGIIGAPRPARTRRPATRPGPRRRSARSRSRSRTRPSSPGSRASSSSAASSSGGSRRRPPCGRRPVFLRRLHRRRLAQEGRTRRAAARRRHPSGMAPTQRGRLRRATSGDDLSARGGQLPPPRPAAAEPRCHDGSNALHRGYVEEGQRRGMQGQHTRTLPRAGLLYVIPSLTSA